MPRTSVGDGPAALRRSSSVRAVLHEPPRRGGGRSSAHRPRRRRTRVSRRPSPRSSSGGDGRDCDLVVVRRPGHEHGVQPGRRNPLCLGGHDRPATGAMTQLSLVPPRAAGRQPGVAPDRVGRPESRPSRFRPDAHHRRGLFDAIRADAADPPGRPRYGEGVGLHLSQIDEADELLTSDPLALLIGMVLDQPVSER
ncbi:hypothetical protein FMEAI12_3640057 [Parafrankia sp. Ea1.12]|nr:hypothetical protein FMEAI12_3640057 [Parafrankia sp. Ea1.12]